MLIQQDYLRVFTAVKFVLLDLSKKPSRQNLKFSYIAQKSMLHFACNVGSYGRNHWNLEPLEWSAL